MSTPPLPGHEAHQAEPPTVRHHPGFSRVDPHHRPTPTTQQLLDNWRAAKKLAELLEQSHHIDHPHRVAAHQLSLWLYQSLEGRRNQSLDNQDRVRVLRERAAINAFTKDGAM